MSNEEEKTTGRKKRSSRKDMLRRKHQIYREQKVIEPSEEKQIIQTELKEDTMSETAIESTAETTPSAGGGFNPFSQPVKQREYTKKVIEANIGVTPENYVEQPIPEPTYDKPPMDSPQPEPFTEAPKPPPSNSYSPPPNNGGAAPNSGMGGASSPPPSSASVNPSLDDLDEKQKKKSSKANG